MAASTGVVFSANVTAQMEATVGFSFTFGSFPEVTVPRNPASDSPAAGGNVVAGVRSDLTPQAPAASRIPESESYDVAATPTRMTRRPDGSSNDLIFQIYCVSRSITECIRLGELTTPTVFFVNSATLPPGPDQIWSLRDLPRSGFPNPKRTPPWSLLPGQPIVQLDQLTILSLR